jgi:ketosteroid isomerase-like protein
MTTRSSVSRRSLLVVGAASLTMACGGAARAPASGATSAAQERIRSWYAAWERKDWSAVDAMTTEDFTFSSAAGDDHISKSAYKTQCWDTQSGRIAGFELESVIDNGIEAFVKGKCRTKNGSTFENVEHFTFRGDKIASIECYFGSATGYPSAADKASKG